MSIFMIVLCVYRVDFNSEDRVETFRVFSFRVIWQRYDHNEMQYLCQY
jgi:hypothetical protein